MSIGNRDIKGWWLSLDDQERTAAQLCCTTGRLFASTLTSLRRYGVVIAEPYFPFASRPSGFRVPADVKAFVESQAKA